MSYISCVLYVCLCVCTCVCVVCECLCVCTCVCVVCECVCVRVCVCVCHMAVNILFHIQGCSTRAYKFTMGISNTQD